MEAFSKIDYGFKTTDVMGFKMPIKRFDNYDHTFWSLLPDNIDEHLLGIRESEVRSDDVFICTYPRSGTNWTNEIVRMLCNGNANYINKDEFLFWFDTMPKHTIEDIPSPRVFVSHLPFRFLPTQIAEKGRVICVFRNPKDVAVSFYNWARDITFADFDGSFDDYLKLFYNGDVPSGSWFEHVQNWESVIENKLVKSLLPIHYEDMHNDLRGSVEKIADFLGIKDDGELFTNIVKNCTFSSMVKDKKANVPEIVALLSKDRGNYVYRKGKVGDWKNVFTVAQNEQFNKIYADRMKNSKLSHIFSK